MRRNRWIVLGIFVGLAVWLFFALGNKEKKRERNQALTTAPTTTTLTTQATPPATTATPAPPSQAERRRRSVELVQSIYSAPIAFYGKAQDQHGQPVVGAKVQYSALDKFWEPGTKYEGLTDTKGFFSITGIQGAALSVQVSKEGYDRIYNQSDGAFSFGAPYDPQRDRPTPTKDNPTIFVLRKKTLADPLFAIDRDVPVPKNGTPVEISLKTGKPIEAGRGDLKIETWTSDQAKDAQGHYEWRCRLSVPGGGLLVRTEKEFRFDAPETGYEPSIEFHMPKTAVRWQEDQDEEYWLKLGNETYARMRLRITTGGGHFASITSYLNPSGSRNLEFDPAKVINPR
jgi:hypothetical protein